MSGAVFLGPNEYPLCQYAATQQITSLTDVTHFDFNGRTLGVGDSALFHVAGTYCGIYKWSGTIWEVVTTTWVRGFTVKCELSAGSPTFKQTAETGSATPVFQSVPQMGDAIVAPHIPPTYRSLVDLALSSDAAAAFPAITFPTLAASRNYSCVARTTVSMAVDSDSTGSCDVYVLAKIWFETNSSGVPTNVTVDPTPTINATDAVPTGLLGCTANVIASTAGITVTATRKSGVAMHASYEAQIQNFRDVGAASEIYLPTDISGLLWWYKSGSLITVSGTDLVTWGDSSGNGCTGTVITDAGKTKAQYSPTGGAGLAGARVILAAGNPNGLHLPTNWLNSHDPAITAMQVFHVFKLAADPPNLGGQGGLCKLGGGAGGALVPMLGSATIYDDTASNTQTNTGFGTGGVADSVCCFSSIGAAGRRAIRFNGAELWTSASNTVGHDNSPRLWVIGDDPHTYYFVGEYYEIFAFDHELASGDLAKIDGYLMTGKSGAGGFGVHA